MDSSLSIATAPSELSVRSSAHVLPFPCMDISLLSPFVSCGQLYCSTPVSQGLRRKHAQKDLKQASGIDDLIGLVAHIICKINRDQGF